MKYSKFRAKPTIVDGIRFASKSESVRYSELKLLERAGQISGLELQPRFSLSVNGHHICEYRGDFEYTERGKHIVEDRKGFRTPEYKVKSKLFMALHPEITFRETEA